MASQYYLTTGCWLSRSRERCSGCQASVISAVTGGARDETVAAYLDSILEFAGVEDERLAVLSHHRRTTGSYPTTEAGILEAYDRHLSEDEGLRLVLEACEELEIQVSHLSRSQRQEEEPADVS